VLALGLESPDALLLRTTGPPAGMPARWGWRSRERSASCCWARNAVCSRGCGRSSSGSRPWASASILRHAGWSWAWLQRPPERTRSRPARPAAPRPVARPCDVGLPPCAWWIVCPARRPVPAAAASALDLYRGQQARELTPLPGFAFGCRGFPTSRRRPPLRGSRHASSRTALGLGGWHVHLRRLVVPQRLDALRDGLLLPHCSLPKR
jgi:hypothetical protein